MQRYNKLFTKLAHRNEIAFIPFVVLGDPDLATSVEVINTLIANGADALEIGIPFSDPVADGPVIQRACVRAINAGHNWKNALSALKAIRARHDNLPIGLLNYANLVMANGIENYYEQVSLVGIDSVLMPEVPVFEIAPFKAIADKNNIDTILIVPPNADDDKIRQISNLGSGYTYVVTRKGVTGSDDDLTSLNQQTILELNKQNAPPAVFGFGISNSRHVQQAKNAGAAGVISGSAIVKKIEDNLNNKKQMLQEIGDFVREMKQATFV